ncbi:MAG TPA: TetR/AcrR family transcriptional regulator [Perlabentimonas sp.]|nr:TetR/AcrR family transcriptional regulator [Bacteroidales bacterium]MDD4671924.1 TetR/AcrR family transcriptional regulator [Bacteroidales bacterium]MDY0348541.1 TetR/AcrR family transcriptional regulator [Tenuifilaceae bacterium]HZJ74938.1 TetR/AcrR family transcriptional regulator [Perlabentimonas sp.]
MDIREKILEGAGNLFMKNGIRVITMDSIAQSLGISKRTIYENFKDKEDLIRSFLTRNVNTHKNDLIIIGQSSANVIESLFEFGRYNSNAFAKINPIFFDDLKKYYSDMFESIKKSEKFGNGEVSYLILKRGINEGTFVKTIDIDIVNTFIHTTMNHFFKTDEHDSIPHSKVWYSVFLPYIRGICTEKGLEHLDNFLSTNENFTSK